MVHLPGAVNLIHLNESYKPRPTRRLTTSQRRNTIMPAPQTDPTTADQRITAAQNRARREALLLARDAGAQTITRPLYPGAATTITDVESLAGARAARDLEYGARGAARDYIRQAREAGKSWAQIGEALGLTPNGDADQAGMTVAEAAYTYAAGSPDTDTAIRYGRSFIWRCTSCDQVIGDRGLIAGPAEDEHGHAEACPRLAAAVAEWDAGWEAEP